MGGSHSREDLLSDSDSEDAESRASDNSSDYGTPPPASASSKLGSGVRPAAATPASIDAIDRHLRELHIKYNQPISPNPSPGPTPTPSAANAAALNAVKLYLHIGGSSPSARWIISDRLAAASLMRTGDDEDDDAPATGPWCLVVGSKIRARVGPELQLKTFPVQRRVDFVANGVWALKFFHADGFSDFCAKYHSCLFENSYGVAATDEGRAKVFGKDFAAWARPEDGDESIWEDATDGFSPGPKGSPMPQRTPVLKSVMEDQDLQEFEEPVEEGSGIRSLALGALDNSFLVGDKGIEVVRNFEHGIHGKGMSVKFSGGSTSFSTPKKALLMRAETNMLLMSPATDGKPHAKGVHQFDIETGKVVSEWKFGKDGADINMRDITNDSKGAQLDPSESTFLGLDDNRLCRWDMRDRRGIVQNLASATESPVLQWTQGHQFSRGTNFQCFASTGDGSIVVGSLDGKIRLYSTSSMRMAKTAFPGLGSPITHVDVTYDGKWILGTTDTYLILICTIFIDKDGKEKTGFSGRMGNRIAAPRLLKLNPLDSHLAGANNRFREGRFSWVTENGKQERHLVATVGKYSVVWNFLQVKNSHHECYQFQEGLKSCYCYKVIPKDESIVASRFMHDRYSVSDSPEAPLVVATPMKGTKMVYKHLATMYFVFVFDSSENELAMVDLIQVFVQTLDRCFKNVCELHIIFNFNKLHTILDEMILGGQVIEVQIVKSVEEIERLEIQSSTTSFIPKSITERFTR